MKKETIQYFCDNKGCGKETTLADSVAIEIRYEFGSTWVYLKSGSPIKRHLCKDCAEKLGIIRKVVVKEQVVPEVKTTAEQLYDILSQIVWENQRS